MRAAFTIVSNNYLAAARVLAESYRDKHPDHRFFVVLADTPDGQDGEPFELIPMGDLPIPGADLFPYQYDIMELNTALKPFAFQEIFRRAGVHQLLYLDPDIEVFGPLDEAWDCLLDHDVVLTPHLREPFDDDAEPGERAILRSGTYNLGFLGLRAGSESTRLLAWWAERLHSQCVVEPANGLFVDQKWLDLVPGYFANVAILRHAGYNVAYWNLHERRLEHGDDGLRAGGQPLRFFHFSGFDPRTPERLSRHQNRHEVADSVVLQALCTGYARRLRIAGDAVSRDRRWCFSELGNGIPFTRHLRRVVRECLRLHLPFPSPARDPDGFCQFATTPDPTVFGRSVAPVVTTLLDLRPDLMQAFPGAGSERRHRPFLAWLQRFAPGEESLGPLLERYGDCLTERRGFERLSAAVARRPDLQRAFPGAFTSRAGFRRLREWMHHHGEREEGLDAADIERCTRGLAGFQSCLVVYVLLESVSQRVPLIYSDASIDAVADALVRQVPRFGILDQDGIACFRRVARARRDAVLLFCLQYSPAARSALGGPPSVFRVDRLRRTLEEHGAGDRLELVLDWLLAGHDVSLQVQLGVPQQPRGSAAQEERAGEPGWIAGVDDRVIERPAWAAARAGLGAATLDRSGDGVTLCGYLAAQTGMGQAAHLMERLLREAGIRVSTLRIPTPHDASSTDIGIDLPAAFGRHHRRSAANLIVVNADAMAATRRWIPEEMWKGKPTAAYWLWETERLPRRYAGNARGLDAVWTASRYCADAIRAVVDLPVDVVPLRVDLERLATVRPDHARFGLPDDCLLIGYMFDSKSGLERKNPQALVRAFADVFGGRRDVGLVMKVNSALSGLYDYERLKMAAAGLNVFWIEATLDHATTMSLLRCLDVYASLHRSEGFGLSIAEAMAMSIPVLASGYGGNIDFMEAAAPLLVPCSVIETSRAHGPYPAGTRWAEPSHEAACQALRALECSARRTELGALGRRCVEHSLAPPRIQAALHRALGRLSPGFAVHTFACGTPDR